jgi:hypothetical protein
LRKISALWYSPRKVAIEKTHVLNSFQTSGNSPGAARCRVGILGFGIVGSALARRLTGPDSFPSLELTLICDRRAREKRARQPQRVARLVWTGFDDLLALTGAGAGGDATAVAALGDLIAIARDRAAIVPAPALTEPETILGLPDRQLELAEAV